MNLNDNLISIQKNSYLQIKESKKKQATIFDDLPFHMDGYLRQNLQTFYNNVTKSNLSFNLLIVGLVGTGKSTLGGQSIYGMDRTFNINRYFFEPADFRKYLADKDLHSGIFDEAEEAFSSTENRKFINIELGRLLQRSRLYKKFNGIIMPDFFELSKPLAVYHTQAMLRCVFKPNYKENRLTQGEFYYYDYERKALLYHKGKPTYNYNAVKPVFWGSFSKWFPGDYDEYESIKDKSMEKYRVPAVKEVKPRNLGLDNVKKAKEYANLMNQGKKNIDIAKEWHIDRRRASEIGSIARVLGFLDVQKRQGLL